MASMTVTALLLAGGLSTRMGRDKANLVVNGEALWARQLRILRELTPQDILLSARSAPAWAPADVQQILDTPPSRGPLSGITVGLERMNTTHLLVLAVDLPNMTSAHLSILLSLSTPGHGIAPFQKGYFEPLAAVYPKEATSAARRALTANEFSMQSFIRSLVQTSLLKEYPLSEEEASLYWNLNTPVDLQRPP
jgi:molybdenum cofactor guanylyltransferase